MSYTRRQWAISFLNGLGNSNPSDNVINWVINWTAAEGSNVGGQGAYNLLNTEQHMPGSTNFNSVGVQSFTSYDQGIQANDKVIENGLYPDLLGALRSNNESALGFGGMPTAGVMANLNTWCGNCGYGGWFAHQPPSPDWLLQQFQGSASSSSSSSGSVPGPSDLLSLIGLPKASDVKTFVERFMIVWFGLLIIMIGVLAVFFSSKAGKQTIQTGEQAATTAAMA